MEVMSTDKVIHTDTYLKLLYIYASIKILQHLEKIMTFKSCL